MECLKLLLAKSKYPYELIHHETRLRSAEEGAKYFNIAIGQTAPTLIVKTDIGFLALVVSGSHGRVDFKEVAKILNCQKVKLAKPTEVENMGYILGNVPLVGIPLPYILDTTLFEHSFVYGGTGIKDYTLKVSPHALAELNQIIAKF
ncbi:MAG: YbaK/prolyl-tRNA synthetase associated region [Firmicutes bacterium]|nr:YbaK/prolyl-tRNA synthetase associated region [Bacillota bacterium]